MNSSLPFQRRGLVRTKYTKTTLRDTLKEF